MERSAIRGRIRHHTIPDFASPHPGYETAAAKSPAETAGLL
jgi:hypothetical protein